ncbi:MAG: alpha-galactosidase [Eubacterium sp.]
MQKIFVLNTKNTHYALGIDDEGRLRHIHWGKKASEQDYEIFPIWDVNSNYSDLDTATMEYTVFGGKMYRNCAFKCVYPDGCRDSVFTFKNADCAPGRLTIVMQDKAYAVELALVYEYSEDTDIITRYARVKNNTGDVLVLDKIASAEINLPGDAPYEIKNTNGSWGAEFQIEKTTLQTGMLTFESRKGTMGHTNSPFFIASRGANEDEGAVYFASLGYGGNFKIELQRSFDGKTRAVMGISDFDFTYHLQNGEEFVTPKAYMGFANGFNDMSNQMSDFAVKNILPKSFADKPLPVLYNSWEATGFDVNAQEQLKLAGLAKSIGCELFVMDDGWFGKRNNDRAGLGDWFVNEEKFPNGIDELIDGVNALGMDFGLWFEPEMVQKDSDLYRAHPDWIYYYKNRESSELRNQLVLNLTKPEVEQYVFDCMDKMLEKHNIRYIKWDMNRPFSEIGAENLENPRELWYRHTMAVYRIADKLKAKYPYLQLEACASGGGRAEYGAMEHFDMVWTSDNTDPLDRFVIQNGFSQLYPIKCMRAWVTDWNDNNRPVSLEYRFNSSMQGSLSVGANLLRFSDKDLEKAKECIALYKEYRSTIQLGSHYRIKNIEDDGFVVNQYVSRDRSEAIVFIAGGADSIFNRQFKTYSLRGLDENAKYRVEDGNNTYEKTGAYLMNKCMDVRIDRPLYNKILRLKKLTQE